MKACNVGLDQDKLIFQDVTVVFVRRRGVFVRVSPNRLQKINIYSVDDDEVMMAMKLLAEQSILKHE